MSSPAELLRPSLNLRPNPNPFEPRPQNGPELTKVDPNKTKDYNINAKPNFKPNI